MRYPGGHSVSDRLLCKEGVFIYCCLPIKLCRRDASRKRNGPRPTEPDQYQLRPISRDRDHIRLCPSLYRYPAAGYKDIDRHKIDIADPGWKLAGASRYRLVPAPRAIRNGQRPHIHRQLHKLFCASAGRCVHGRRKPWVGQR